MNYQTIFTGHRAESYQSAMTKFPFARENEFRLLFENFPLSSNELVLDLPSGGGYLSRLFLENNIKSIEFTEDFGVDNIDIEKPWDLGMYDRVVCLAATHHIDNFESFMVNLSSCVYPSGLIHIADVEMDSRISSFLDNFVDYYNPLGHRGHYRNWSELLWPDNLVLVSNTKKLCPWVFSNIEDMICFCKNLFGVRECPDETLLNALMEYVGYEQTKDKLILNWELMYVDLIKKSPSF
jgi:hypothetical protein